MPVREDYLVSAFQKEDSWPGDEPELEDDACPVDVGVVAEAIDPVRRVDRNRSLAQLGFHADVAAVAGGTDMGDNRLSERFAGEATDGAGESEAG